MANMTEVIKQALEEANQISIERASEMIKPEIIAVKEAASYLCMQYVELINDLKSFQPDRPRYKALYNRPLDPEEENEYQTIVRKMDLIKSNILDRNEISKFMVDVSKFQAALNNLLGQEMRFVYVYTGPGSGPSQEIKIYELDEEAGKIFKSDNFNLIAGKAVSLSKSEIMANGTEINKSKFNFSLTGLQTAYRETLYRAQVSKKKLGLSRKVLILWKVQKEWSSLYIPGTAFLAEAYAGFYLANQSNPDFKTSFLEKLVDDFITNETYGAVNADNESGLLKGDVDLGKIQYAIKSGKDFQSLGIDQVIALAEAVSTAPETIDLKSFTEKLKEKLHTSSNAVGKVENLVAEHVIDYVNDKKTTKTGDNEIKEILKEMKNEFRKRTISIYT